MEDRMTIRDCIFRVITGGILSLAVYVPPAVGQRSIDVPAGYGTLQAALSADSLNRIADPNTVYLVHRGTSDSVYYMTSTLTNWGPTPLHIRSVGTGDLPTFIFVSMSDGSAYSPLIGAKKDLYLSGVAIDGYNTLGVPSDRIIRIQADSLRIVLDTVRINTTAQSFIRVDNNHARIFLRNCRFSNAIADWANARGVDNRGVTIDTLSVVECTYFRLAYRVYRDGGGILTYGYFDHNTFTENGSTILGLGSAIHIVFTNNLAVNVDFLGHGISSAGSLLGIKALPGAGQTAYITHNVFWSDTATLYPVYRELGDTLSITPWFADTLDTMITAEGLEGTNIESPVTFVYPPNNLPGAVTLDSLVRWYYQDPITNGNNASILEVKHVELVDLAYNTDAPAYTFGTDGRPVGATEWFENLVAVPDNHASEVPQGFALLGNYPNPFNPTTVVKAQWPVTSAVRLAVYDVLGREVTVLANGRYPAGTYSFSFNAAQLASGVYFCRLTANQFSATHSMLLLK
jgi:hypothetical protein